MLQASDAVVLEQGTPEWLEARMGCATGSRFKDVMSKGRGGGESVGRAKYRVELALEQLLGLRAETFTSKAMENGTEIEPLARLRYELETGNEVAECGFFIHPTLMAGASPDGLVNSSGLLEIKCPQENTHLETLRKQEVPSQYYWQIMGQMWITGRQWCDFVSFNPNFPANAQIFIKRVLRDDEQIRNLEDEVKEFLSDVALEVAFIQNYGKE